MISRFLTKALCQSYLLRKRKFFLRHDAGIAGSPCGKEKRFDFYFTTYVLVVQLCLTICDPMDYNLPGSSVHGICQARILEWVAISFLRGSSQPRDQTCVSCTGRPILYHRTTRGALILRELQFKTLKALQGQDWGYVGGCKMGKGCQKVQASSYKINILGYNINRVSMVTIVNKTVLYI